MAGTSGEEKLKYNAGGIANRYATRGPKNRISAFRVLQLLPGMGPTNAQRCFTRFEAAGHAWSALGGFTAPPLAADAWPAFVNLMSEIAPDDAYLCGGTGSGR